VSAAQRNKLLLGWMGQWWGPFVCPGPAPMWPSRACARCPCKIWLTLSVHRPAGNEDALRLDAVRAYQRRGAAVPAPALHPAAYLFGAAQSHALRASAPRADDRSDHPTGRWRLWAVLRRLPVDLKTKGY